jgi:hypothetical protein
MELTAGRTKVTGRRGRRPKQLVDDVKEKRGILEIERRSTSLHSVKNLLWKRLWACRKTDKRMNELRISYGTG